MQRQTMPSCVPTFRQVVLEPQLPQPKDVHSAMQHCC